MESSRPLTPEEEALKRNTDCVYFLASPLTCKKGNECEFRHCEGARVNPRDCWYWLNGNCLNPKCQFRHPPLDGLFGIPGTPSGRSAQAVASKHIPVAAYPPNPYNPSKQSVPCYYFQKGQCIKGDKCPFMHFGHSANNLITQQSTNGPSPAAIHDSQQLMNGPNSTTNHAVQQEPMISTSFTGTSQKVSWGLKECSSGPQINPKVVSAKQSPSKSASKDESCPLVQRNLQPYSLDHEPWSHPSAAPVSSDSTQSRPHLRSLQSAEEEHYLNGRDADEFLGESSPGFDVLVDDDTGDADYYHEEDQGDQPIADFDYRRHDYETVSTFERDRYDEKIEHGRFDRRTAGQYGQNHHRTSSERDHKRRTMHRESSLDEVDASDLRHRLLKRRRVNDPDLIGESRRRGDWHVEDRHRGFSSGRERRYEARAFSSRLQGRISLPVRSPPRRPAEMQFERDRGRLRDRLSQCSATNYNQRPQDRMRFRNEEFAADGRGFRAQSNRRDDGDPMNFAGPKSLAELKGSKAPRSSVEQQTKWSDVLEDPASFEGPKSLSDNLQKKRTSDEGENLEIKAVEGEDEGINTEADGLAYSDEPLPKGYAHDDPEETLAGDFENEAVEGADLNAYEDDENQEEDEDDDEDDFAKKVGALFS